MDSEKLRKNFLDFFEEREHKIIPSSSLIPLDPSVLFTSAGMQQFKPYYLGESSPYGKNVATCQKCFRTSDIDEVGDERHLTFFEMLGNFSFEGYFKKETIEMAFEFLIKNCGLEKEKIWITFFKGENEIPTDDESPKIWRKMGIPKEKIIGFGKKDNFWGPTGKEGPCGPTSEIHYQLRDKPCEKEKKCLPNCECGRFIEIWNLVFNEYYQDENGKITSLKQKGVDTGMGLERLAMVCQKKENVFETDLFLPIVEQLRKISSYSKNTRAERIIVDHIKGAVFLISEGILPSNIERGYVLRRILRRAIRYGKVLNLPKNFFFPLVKKVIEIYEHVYSDLRLKENEILTAIQNEQEKFERTLSEGLKKLDAIISHHFALGSSQREKIISGKKVFDLYQSYGFPLELTREILKERGFQIDEKEFFEELERHKEVSKVGAEKKFGGIGKTPSYEAVKLHTATHLLHAALRKILGKNVKQMGSDITSERLRFDFSFPRKLTKEEIKKVEDLVNEKIKENLKVERREMDFQEAIEFGALAFFKEKYPKRVSVYIIGDFSKEICAGPHVRESGELGHFKIEKEEAIGSGIRRIKAILEFDKIK